MIKLISIYASLAFMCAQSDGDVDAQIHTLYQLRKICKNQGYKTIQHRILTKHYSIAVKPMAEDRNVLNNLNFTNLPDHLITMRTDLLRSTTFDADVTSNSGKKNIALEALSTGLR